MNLKILIKSVILILLLSPLTFILYFLIPADYDVAQHVKRKNTAYWQLKTGSIIGYTKIGSRITPKKEPIIYLHGGPGGQITDETINVLSPLSTQGYDLYFYDQVGSGHSNRLKNIKEYTIRRHVEDLKSIIDEIGSEKVILIGHSWGACLAINFLQTHPETISKIIVSGPGPILPIKNSLSNVSPPDSLHLIEPSYSNREANQKMYSWRSTIIRKWANLFGSKLVRDREVDDFFTLLSAELNKSCDCQPDPSLNVKGGNGYYSHIMTMKSLNDIEEKRIQLKKLKTPLLILRGQCDNQSWGYVQEYLDIFSNSHLHIISDVGHTIINRKAEEYFQLIHDFLVNSEE